MDYKKIIPSLVIATGLSFLTGANSPNAYSQTHTSIEEKIEKSYEQFNPKHYDHHKMLYNLGEEWFGEKNPFYINELGQVEVYLNGLSRSKFGHKELSEDKQKKRDAIVNIGEIVNNLHHNVGTIDYSQDNLNKILQQIENGDYLNNNEGQQVEIFSILHHIENGDFPSYYKPNIKNDIKRCNKEGIDIYRAYNTAVMISYYNKGKFEKIEEDIKEIKDNLKPYTPEELREKLKDRLYGLYKNEIDTLQILLKEDLKITK